MRTTGPARIALASLLLLLSVAWAPPAGAAVSPVTPTVDFGPVLVGQSATRQITYTADPSDSVAFATMLTAGTPFRVDAFDACAAPGLCVVTVTFTPTQAGRTSAGAELEYNCADTTTSPPSGCSQAETVVTGTGVAPLRIATTTMPDGQIGQEYSPVDLQADGGTGPFTWSLAAGRLPSGLGLNPAGTVSGSPSAAGSYSFTLRVSDPGPPVQVDTREYVVTIRPGVADLAVSIGATPNPVTSGKTVTYSVSVVNQPLAGATNATGIRITDVLPAATAFLGVAPGSFTCTTPAIGATGAMACTLPALAVGAPAEVLRFSVKVTAKKTNVSNSATVAADANTLDPVSLNDTATVSVRVR